jgi:hypothetical protein
MKTQAPKKDSSNMKLSLSLVTFLVLFSATSAEAAVEAQKVADALTARLASLGFVLKVMGAESQGANVMLKGVTFNIKGETKPDQVLGDVLLEGVTEADSGYKVAVIAAPPNKVVDGSLEIDFGGVKVSNLTIASADEADPVKAISMYEKIEFGPVTFTDSGVKAVSMDGAMLSLSPYAAGQTVNTTITIPNIVWNLETVKDAAAQEFFASAGYKEFAAALDVQGSWNPVDGRMVISQEAITVKDVGKLNFTTDLSGYTTQFMKSIQDMTKSAAGQTEAQNGAQVMGLLQSLTLNTMSLRFDDASITGKVLDFASKKTGQPRESLVAQVKGMAPLITMQMGDAEFTTKFSNAVSAFMDNPRSIEIKTGAAVPFSLLMGAAMSNPMSLVQQFKLDIVANQ